MFFVAVFFEIDQALPTSYTTLPETNVFVTKNQRLEDEVPLFWGAVFGLFSGGELSVSSSEHTSAKEEYRQALHKNVMNIANANLNCTIC